MHIHGRVAYYVFQGPYRDLSRGWQGFMTKLNTLGLTDVAGPPGDVYVCDPDEHKGAEKTLTTIMWAPFKG